ncbi:MAG: DUF3048 domain-containing protein [Ilumatobacteraceae bacterium]
MVTLRTRRALVALSLLSLVGAACGGGSSTGDTVAEGDTTVPEGTPEIGPVYPLTGLPVSDEATAQRVAIVVKIDNHPSARPQTGLNKADLVFEENVEGITRFAAVFHSQGSDPVGPIRSGRTQDIDMLASMNKPLFAWSGGNARVTKAVNSSTLVNVGHSASRGKGGYYREKTRKAPHNLYAKTTDLWTLAPEGSAPPVQQFVYRGPSDARPATAVPVDGGKIQMYGIKVYWKWDATTGSFVRFMQNSKGELEPHEADGSQISAKNVLVLYHTYVRSKADRKSPHADTTGKGTGFVLTDGAVIPVTWSRLKGEQPYALRDSAGAVVRLTPGNSWIEVASKNVFAQVDPGVDPKTVKWPAL